MKQKMTLRLLGCAYLGVCVMFAPGGAVMAQDKVAAPAALAREIKDERALKLLKEMSDTLANSKSLGFRARGLVPTMAPSGQYISLLASSRVIMQRPDKLFVEARGDLFPSDIYFDGKTVTAVGQGKKFYAQREATGSGIDTFAQSGHPGSDSVAPFFDMLAADPYAALTKDFSTAIWVGQSTVSGVKADHLAFTSKGLDWELWIGAADKLPRLMVVSYRLPERQPTFTVEYSDWKLNAPVPPQTFTAIIPSGAMKLEFKPEVAPQTK